MKPKILLATTRRWFPTTRLAMALASAGCQIEAVCPARNALATTKAVLRVHRYHGLAPLASFMKAIDASKPDLIVSGDDLATRHLFDLHAKSHADENSGAALRPLIERSLGAPESFPIVAARAKFLRVAIQQGVRAPQTETAANIAELRGYVEEHGLPLVLKSDGTWGGDGVRIVHSWDDAIAAFRTLQAPPLLARAMKRALVDRDATLVRPSLLRQRHTVNVQEFVPGTEATSAVFCWNGSVLAALHFEVLRKSEKSGPASVLRLVENADMTEAAEKMVRALNLSGVHGFDFMIESGTSNAHLIEINPRATQVGHLAMGPGRDIPAALCAALSGGAIQPTAPVTRNHTIALFPQEWLRDPRSPYFWAGYHDVPWDEPELIRACIRENQSSWSSTAHSVLPLFPIVPNAMPATLAAGSAGIGNPKAVISKGSRNTSIQSNGAVGGRES